MKQLAHNFVANLLLRVQQALDEIGSKIGAAIDTDRESDVMIECGTQAEECLSALRAIVRESRVAPELRSKAEALVPGVVAFCKEIEKRKAARGEGPRAPSSLH